MKTIQAFIALIFISFIAQAQNKYNPLSTPTPINKKIIQTTGKTKHH